MMKHSNARRKANADDDPATGEPADEGGAVFSWEFESDDSAGSSNAFAPRGAAGPTVGARAQHEVDKSAEGGKGTRANDRVRPGASGVQDSRAKRTQPVQPGGLSTGHRVEQVRANYVRKQLDLGLDRWWALGEVPSLELLRDGLHLLEAGGSVSESHRTLLLRAALVYNRGVQTALRHQLDLGRVALVLAEALVEWEMPLLPGYVAKVVAGNERLRDRLLIELEQSRVLSTGDARHRAEMAIGALSGQEKLQKVPRGGGFGTAAPIVRRPIRQILFILLVISAVAFVLWQQRRIITPAGMVAMPAATYYLLGGGGSSAGLEPVQLDAFFMDRFEVVNRDYRACVEEDACLWPLETSSAKRVDYFIDPAFDRHPVVNVTQAMAERYCSWKSKRLPSAAEWQAAAGVSPSTGQLFRFPWGERFEAQRANSGVTGFGDTVAVGSFQPGGNSPSGAADMVGNVAEWTSTLLPGGETGAVYAVVKGGSFASLADDLDVGMETHVEVGRGTPEIGFRCVRSRPAG